MLKKLKLLFALRKVWKKLSSKEAKRGMKAGIKSTEFWTTIGVVAASLATALATQDGTLRIVGLACAALSAAAYAIARGLAKLAGK